MIKLYQEFSQDLSQFEILLIDDVANKTESVKNLEGLSAYAVLLKVAEALEKIQ